jgi:hypothetical protein
LNGERTAIPRRLFFQDTVAVHSNFAVVETTGIEAVPVINRMIATLLRRKLCKRFRMGLLDGLPKRLIGFALVFRTFTDVPECPLGLVNRPVRQHPLV